MLDKSNEITERYSSYKRHKDHTVYAYTHRYTYTVIEAGVLRIAVTYFNKISKKVVSRFSILVEIESCTADAN